MSRIGDDMARLRKRAERARNAADKTAEGSGGASRDVPAMATAAADLAHARGIEAALPALNHARREMRAALAQIHHGNTREAWKILWVGAGLPDEDDEAYSLDATPDPASLSLTELHCLRNQLVDKEFTLGLQPDEQAQLTTIRGVLEEKEKAPT